MKNSLFLLLLGSSFSLFSCKSVDLSQSKNAFAMLSDYQQFADQGVIISPYSCENKKYLSIGEVSALCVPEIRLRKEQIKGIGDELYPQDSYHAKYAIGEPDMYQGLQEMVNLVKAQGGNAIFDIKYNLKTETKGGLAYNVISITGFAVRLAE